VAPDEGRTHRRRCGAGLAGVGLELRLLYDGELRRSQVYRLAGDLESEAGAKRLELQGRGWQ
jgi:hypothetical protein